MSLFSILKYMDRYQDLVKVTISGEKDPHFMTYEEHMERIREKVTDTYEKRKQMILKKTYFFDVVVPLVYASLESSLLEYQLMLHKIEFLDSGDQNAEIPELEEVLDAD